MPDAPEPDRIWIRGLTCRTYIGVEDWEQRERQEVRIDIEIETRTGPAGETDHIDDTVNYRTVSKRTLALVEENRFALVEKLAEQVCGMILREFPGADAVTLTVAKPGALRFADSVGVRIVRRR
ncbi:MAG: dihydroneopterin aldolase [Planctomycetota bacterium]